MLERTRIVLVCVALAACAGPADDGATARDPLTQRQRDSIVGASSLPGAGAVRRALESSDAATDRAARLDSLLSR